MLKSFLRDNLMVVQQVKKFYMYVFVWVFPRRLIVVCRRFGTLYLFHLHRQDVKCEVHFILHIQPMKMEQIECSETSANHNQTPGKYPNEYIQDSKHGESLKSRIPFLFLTPRQYTFCEVGSELLNGIYMKFILW